MGYLFLFTGILSGAVKGFCGKKTSGLIKKPNDAVLANGIRMLFCILIGFFFVLIGSGGLKSFSVDRTFLLVSLMSGISTSSFVVTWLLCVRKGAYVMMDIFSMAGVIVPLVASELFFSESVRLIQWFGFALLMVSVIIICNYNNSIKEKLSASSYILLILCGLASGFVDLSQKVFTKTIENGSVSVFNFYTYVFSSVILFLFYAISKSRDKEKPDKKALRSMVIYILIMSVMLFLNSYFLTLAARYIPSARLYPLKTGAALLLSMIMSAIFFGEKIKPKCVVGLIISFISILIINLS